MPFANSPINLPKPFQNSPSPKDSHGCRMSTQRKLVSTSCTAGAGGLLYQRWFELSACWSTVLIAKKNFEVNFQCYHTNSIQYYP
jgi:hypothetical protein